MEYIPWGRRIYWQANGDNAVFWDDDVVEVVKVWQELSQHTDHTGRKAFHSWKMRRREIIRKNLNLIPTYQLWRTNRLWPSKRLVEHRQNRLKEERKHAMFEEVKGRLSNAGHKIEDIEMSKLLHSPYLLSSGTVSDEDWQRVGPSFETDVVKIKNFRVALEMEPVTHQRFSVFGEVYEAFLDTLPPLKRCCYPEVSSFRTAKDVVAILEASKSVLITRTHFQSIAHKMQALVDQAHNELKRSLMDAVLFDIATQGGQPWLLAECVFTRFHHADAGPLLKAEDGVLVGWDMITTHRHKGHSTTWLRPGVPVHVPRAFAWNARSSGDSRRLIALAGLPAEVTVTELDERDPRFAWEHEGGPYVLTVFTWRAMLAHLHVNRIYASDYRPRLATEKEKIAAKVFEAIARQQTKAWACNHCPQYLQASDADTKPAVLAHLAERHGITGPEMPKDYFVNERCRHAYEVPYRIKSTSRLDDE